MGADGARNTRRRTTVGEFARPRSMGNLDSRGTGERLSFRSSEAQPCEDVAVGLLCTSVLCVYLFMQSGTIERARLLYERLVAVFPLSGRHWKAYVEHEVLTDCGLDCVTAVLLISPCKLSYDCLNPLDKGSSFADQKLPPTFILHDCMLVLLAHVYCDTFAVENEAGKKLALPESGCRCISWLSAWTEGVEGGFTVCETWFCIGRLQMNWTMSKEVIELMVRTLFSDCTFVVSASDKCDAQFSKKKKGGHSVVHNSKIERTCRRRTSSLKNTRTFQLERPVFFFCEILAHCNLHCIW